VAAAFMMFVAAVAVSSGVGAAGLHEAKSAAIATRTKLQRNPIGLGSRGGELDFIASTDRQLNPLICIISRMATALYAVQSCAVFIPNL
jgi:hypothetical protein